MFGNTKTSLQQMREAKAVECMQQFDSMVADMRDEFARRLRRTLNSGCTPDDYLLPEGFLLTKAVLDCWMRDRPYQPPKMSNHRQIYDDHVYELEWHSNSKMWGLINWEFNRWHVMSKRKLSDLRRKRKAEHVARTEVGRYVRLFYLEEGNV